MLNKKNYLWASGIAIIILLFLLFIYLRSPLNSGESITRVYFADNISETQKKLIEKFNKRYAGLIEIVPIDLPFSKFSTNERKEILARSLRTNSEMIDIFTVDVIWVPRFAKWAENLQPYFNEEELREYLPKALGSCQYKGDLVASPFYIDVGLMYYRKDIISQLPNSEEIIQKLKKSVTWEEMLQLADQLPQYRSSFYLYPAKSFEGLVCAFMDLLNPAKHSITQGDSVNLVFPEAIRALTFLTDLVQKYRLTPRVVLNYDEFQCYLYSLKSDAVFMRGWPGFGRQHRYLVADTTKIDMFDVAALPHFSGETPSPVIGGWNLMVAKSSRKKWAAVKFLKFILEEENQKMIYETGGFIPVNLKVYRDTEFLGRYREVEYLRKLVEQGVHRPYSENYTRISDIIATYAHRAIKGELSPRAALYQATREINHKYIIQTQR
ncbi:MAG: ABC transporter substrate-binding protein [Calditrichia bacterium]